MQNNDTAEKIALITAKLCQVGEEGLTNLIKTNAPYYLTLGLKELKEVGGEEIAETIRRKEESLL